MPIDKAQANGHVETPTRAELARMIDNGEWEKVKELLTPSPEEVEQILSEPLVDAAEVFRRLNITEDEIAEARNSPTPKYSHLPRRAASNLGQESRAFPTSDR